jgi:hypothetical protein
MLPYSRCVWNARLLPDTRIHFVCGERGTILFDGELGRP